MTHAQCLHDLLDRITPVDPTVLERARARQEQLTKPAGALGVLEDVAVKLAGVFGTDRPNPRGASVIVCAGDHGVTREKVSAYPASVTPAMIGNFLLDTPGGPGGAAVSAIARASNVDVIVLDVGVGVDLDLPDRAGVAGAPKLLSHKVRHGTRNLRAEPAMTREETLAAIRAGVKAARLALDAGADFIVPGEMGIGNTTPAAAMTARLLNVDPAQVTGRGTGVNDERLQHKVNVIREALARNASEVSDPLGVLADLGGLEIAAMLGVILETTASKKAVVLDGFVEGAAALVAVLLKPDVRDYLFPAGLCAERGHAAQLAFLNLTPLFSLELRLGEGTGGVLAIPMLRAAAATLREMLTFAEAGVPGA